MNSTLKTLQLKARDQVYTLLSGHNLSKLHGEGYDFAELREYQVGDDVRNINWMITAKLGKPYIKELHADRELSVVVATLMDANLYFGSKNSDMANSKQIKLTEVATLLGYATLQNSDLFTGVIYTQKQTYSTPPTKQLYHIDEFSKTLFTTSLLGTSLDISASMDDLFRRIYKPSLVFVLGDFLEEVDLSLLAQKHEVIAIIIRDRKEENPPNLGQITLLNPKDGAKMDTYFGKKSIEKYLKKLQENDKKLTTHFSKYGIKYVKITTEESIVKKLVSLFI
jgi:uncharacterized protein (DUF58 family)